MGDQIVRRAAVPRERDDHDVLGRTAGLELHEGGHDSVTGGVQVHQQIAQQQTRITGLLEINYVGTTNPTRPTILLAQPVASPGDETPPGPLSGRDDTPEGRSGTGSREGALVGAGRGQFVKVVGKLQEVLDSLDVVLEPK